MMDGGWGLVHIRIREGVSFEKRNSTLYYNVFIWKINYCIHDTDDRKQAEKNHIWSVHIEVNSYRLLTGEFFRRDASKSPVEWKETNVTFTLIKKEHRIKRKKKYLLTQSQKKGRYMRSQDNDRERIEKEKSVEIFFQWAKMANGLPGQSSSGLESQLCHLLVDDLGQVR